MIKAIPHPALPTALALGLGGSAAWAQPMAAELNLSVEPQFLQFSKVGDRAAQAQLDPGLGLSLDSHLLAFDVDYTLRGVVREPIHSDFAPAPAANSLSQKFNALLHSDLLNELLGADAGLRADTLLLAGGDSYRYRISPGISRSLSSLAKLSLKYDYVLDKSSQQSLAKEKRGYSMALDGSLQGGRLLWSSRYRSTSEFEDRLVLTRAVEALDLKSRYHLGNWMQVEVSSAFKHERKFSGATEKTARENRYGAALAWDRYSLGFKLNTRERDGLDRRETFGTGTISWFPRHDLEFTLDYGDRIAGDAPGWLLHTRLDISG